MQAWAALGRGIVFWLAVALFGFIGAILPYTMMATAIPAVVSPLFASLFFDSLGHTGLIGPSALLFFLVPAAFGAWAMRSALFGGRGYAFAMLPLVGLGWVAAVLAWPRVKADLVGGGVAVAIFLTWPVWFWAFLGSVNALDHPVPAGLLVLLVSALAVAGGYAVSRRRVVRDVAVREVPSSWTMLAGAYGTLAMAGMYAIMAAVGSITKAPWGYPVGYAVIAGLAFLAARPGVTWRPAVWVMIAGSWALLGWQMGSFFFATPLLLLVVWWRERRDPRRRLKRVMRTDMVLSDLER